MNRRLLLIDPAAGRWRLETLQVETLEKDPREDYFVLSGETLCQYLLRRDPDALVIARGPLPFISGNKTSVGCISPLTGVPHYSFVGGRAAMQLLNLGLDAICFQDLTGFPKPVTPISLRAFFGLQIGKYSWQYCWSASPQIWALSQDFTGNWPDMVVLRSSKRLMSVWNTCQMLLLRGNRCVRSSSYIIVSGRAPNLTVIFKPAAELPTGQRSGFYWLVERELCGDTHAGSIFTLGEGARLGYRSANLAAGGIYHAGRGGAGAVFARFASALVLRGEPMELSEFFADVSPSHLPPQDWGGLGGGSFARNPNAAIAPLLDKHCARLSGKTGGTITKLFTTGADPAGKNTLPAWNAQRLGYPLADIGGPRVLKATRHGQTGCHWCQVDCRHYHWVPADYAPGGRDMFLDDFEPTYAVFAMLGLTPAEDTFQARLDLRAEVDRRLILPIEQLGCDIIDVGLGLAALFEGVERGIIPESDVPAFLQETRSDDFSRPAPQATEVATTNGHRLEAAVQAVALLRSGQAAKYPALRVAADGPQVLAERYPPMQDIVFTGGRGTLGNAGHSNALWTFLMPFSRFFGHYAGQIYKIEEGLPSPGSDQEAYRACFERVIRRMLDREFFWLLANALSQCAFTFVIFSQDGKGERLSDDDLLVRLLRYYSIQTTHADLEWFSQAFWAQSIDLKCQFGWRPPSAADFPYRVYEALSLALDRPPDELRALMDLLIGEWKRQAGEVLARFGYEASW